MSAIKSNISGEFTTQNEVKLLRAGKDYFDELIRLINLAEESIHIQTYIFADDETGQLVAEALKQAVKRNVEVYLLVDGYASKSISKEFVTDLKNAGIHFRFFGPIFRSKYFYFSRRLHHKVNVIDTKYAFVGGLNIADRYNDTEGIPAWLDYVLYVEGEIVKELCILCWKTWYSYPTNMPMTPCEKKHITFNIPIYRQSFVKMCRNDWVRRKNEISTTYIDMLRSAKSEVTILCSYFLPGKVIRKQMVLAAKRGVTIHVITAGISDVMMAKSAERWLYDWLLRNGIHMYEYQKTVLHGKLAVCDDNFMTIGSYNINNISAYASIELNLNVESNSFARQARETLQKIIVNDCKQISFEQHIKAKNIFKQLWRWFSYHFIRLVLYLFTFYFKRQH